MRCLLPGLLGLLGVWLGIRPVALRAQEPAAAPTTTPTTSTAPFANGLPTEPSFFPLAVWLQSPHNAGRYRELGINLYVGLHEGPTTAQLDELAKVGMRTICEQNEVGLAYRGNLIVGWLHGDEPDNAQAVPGGYGPPIAPSRVLEDYQRMRKLDATRPVLLNLGQGVAWDGWYGRGVRTNHPEDYPAYVQAGDLVSFDIYPVTHRHKDVMGRLEFVGRGVQRLVAWTDGKKPIWACIETSHIDNPKARPDAVQVRREVWQAIACGAQGIVYFAHEFAPEFVEAGLLAHAEIAAAVHDVNLEVLAAAPVLNSPRLPDAVQVRSEPASAIAMRVHRDGEALHVFAVAMQGTPVHARFALPAGTGRGAALPRKVEVVGEGRTLPLDQNSNSFADDFEGYAVHHYRLTP